MDISEILRTLLAFLLKFAELIVSFIISALGLFIDFFRTIVSST